MNKAIVLDTTSAFRAERADMAQKTPANGPDREAPVPGALTRQELRDLVLHWMG